ncbi:hypothetical protein H6A07_04085 [Olsenella uli]|uniref:hypothetical protein n=1 Tax=Olsenella uli TaxID=133926 RepID=UPI00195E2118|nr:hypothetical protein [Olsenella uli]MBM6675925.1 hypothetical protein [Olsenella uli]
MAVTDDAQVSALVEELSGASRRRRQEVAHQLAIVAKAHPDLMVPQVDALVDALYRPEAQTRWEVLDALTAIASVDPDAVTEAFDGAEASLFDDGSATVRLAAFVFLCRYGASSPERSERAWSLLDEAIQCYHGDAEYRDMLAALLGLARGDASEATKQALAARVRFDAESGSGYIKTFSAEILQALE